MSPGTVIPVSIWTLDYLGHLSFAQISAEHAETCPWLSRSAARTAEGCGTRRTQRTALGLPASHGREAAWAQVPASKCELCPEGSGTSSRQCGGAKPSICSPRGSQETTGTATPTSWHELLDPKTHPGSSPQERGGEAPHLGEFWDTSLEALPPDSQPRRGARTGHLQAGSVSKHYLSRGGVCVCF